MMYESTRPEESVRANSPPSASSHRRTIVPHAGVIPSTFSDLFFVDLPNFRSSMTPNPGLTGGRLCRQPAGQLLLSRLPILPIFTVCRPPSPDRHVVYHEEASDRPAVGLLASIASRSFIDLAIT